VQIIPAIDIFDNTCVRLSEGDFASRKSYNVTPRDKALEFRIAGAKYLHVVDLEGAKNRHITNWLAIAELCSVKGLSLQVGGGVRSHADVQRLFNLGVQRIVIGSLAVQSPGIIKDWVHEYGPSAFIIALDLKDGFVATSGWLETDTIPIPDVVESMTSMGITRFLSTDIRRDGLLAGPNTKMYEELVLQYPKVRWYASGGVSSQEDIERLRLTGVEGVIIGKAIYEKRIDLASLWNPQC
jgi:phosphoribosylformimino-5-aminoimidazole carboxamide ribotide isomerase